MWFNTYLNSQIETILSTGSVSEAEGNYNVRTIGDDSIDQFFYMCIEGDNFTIRNNNWQPAATVDKSHTVHKGMLLDNLSNDYMFELKAKTLSVISEYKKRKEAAIPQEETETNAVEPSSESPTEKPDEVASIEKNDESDLDRQYDKALDDFKVALKLGALEAYKSVKTDEKWIATSGTCVYKITKRVEESRHMIKFITVTDVTINSIKLLTVAYFDRNSAAVKSYGESSISVEDALEIIKLFDPEEGKCDA